MGESSVAPPSDSADKRTADVEYVLAFPLGAQSIGLVAWFLAAEETTA